MPLVKKPKRLGGRMFSKTAQNFTTGRYRPATKNLQWQSLFRQKNPYAGVGGAMPGEAAGGGSLGGLGGSMGGLGSGGPGRYWQPPTGVMGGGNLPATGFTTPTTVPPPASQPPAQDPYAAAIMANPSLLVDTPEKREIFASQALPGLFGKSVHTGDIFSALGQLGGGAPGTPGAPGAAPATPGTPGAGQNTGPLADAARLFAGSVEGNPFIDPAGLARLRAGYLPDLNMINPAFWSRTDPVIQQALQGLYQSGSVRPEQVSFAQQQWTPGSLR